MEINLAAVGACIRAMRITDFDEERIKDVEVEMVTQMKLLTKEKLEEIYNKNQW